MLAKEIQSARKAGLVMTVVDGEVRWKGNPQQWQAYGKFFINELFNTYRDGINKMFDIYRKHV